MTLWLGIALLGALGALARFHVGAAVRSRLTGPFPYGTFVVNLTGSFVLGLLIGLSVQDDALLLAGTGLLSGYTTFSTWMVEALRLAERRAWRLMALYLLGSMAAGLAVAGAGWLLGGVAELTADVQRDLIASANRPLRMRRAPGSAARLTCPGVGP